MLYSRNYGCNFQHWLYTALPFTTWFPSLSLWQALWNKPTTTLWPALWRTKCGKKMRHLIIISKKLRPANSHVSGTPPAQVKPLVQFSRSVTSDSLLTHELQHTRLPCPSPTPRACSDSCPSSRWCHLAISSSVIPFSYLQSFSASGCFQMS